MSALFLVLSVAAFGYGYWQNQMVHNALIDSFPLELKDDLTAKFALHGMALRRSTPLSIQRQYVASLAAGALFGLGLSLFVFSVGKTVGGWAFLALFLVGAASAAKAWWTYRKNSAWQAAQGDRERA